MCFKRHLHERGEGVLKPRLDRLGSVLECRCEIAFTEKCTGFDSPCGILPRRIRARLHPWSTPGLFMPSAQNVLLVAGCDWRASVRRPADRRNRGFGRARRRSRCLVGMQQWLVPSPDPRTPQRMHVLFRPPGDGPFRLVADCPRLDAKRAAPRANAAARIPRAGGLAGRAQRFCGAGAGAPRAMARPAENISRTRADATRPTIPKLRICTTADSDQSRAQGLLREAILSSGRTARSSSGTPPVPGARWRWPARTRKDVAAIIAFAPGRGGHANDLPGTRSARRTR